MALKSLLPPRFPEEEKENLEADRPEDQKNEKIVAGLMDITSKAQDNMETPTPNPDDDKPSPVASKPEEKERVKEDIIQKIEKEASQSAANSKVNDPNIKKKLEGEADNEVQSKKETNTNSKKIKMKQDPQQVTPTPNEEDKLPLVSKDQAAPPENKPHAKEKEQEKVDVKDSVPSGNNIGLGISLRIPDKEKNDKKGKEECK